MLSFIYGPAGSGKTDEIYRRAEADAAAGRRAYILVPEQYSMYTEQELISRCGLSAQNRIQVLTFSRLCNMVFAHLGPLRMKYIDKAGKYMSAYKALLDTERELCYFRPNVRQSGFAALCASTFSEFKRYGATSAALANAAEKTENRRLQMKLRDLSLIYKRYNEICCANHSDSEDNLSLIISKIQKCDFLSGTIYINFFRSFTPEEERALSELMCKADVCIALCTDSLTGGSAVFSTQQKTYAHLTTTAAERKISVSAPFRASDARAGRFCDEILHIRNSYFAPRPAPLRGKCNAVHIVRPANRYAEVTECAELISQLVREEGKTLNDFLILVGGIENYEQLIPPIFSDCGIRFFLDKKLPLTESPFMRMILAVSEILAYGFSCERAMLIARSGYFGISDELCDMFENYILAADIGHRQWNMREDWTYNPDKHFFDMERVNEAKQLIVNPILDLADKFRGRKTVETLCTNLRDWLNEIGMHERVGEKIDAFRAENRHELAEQLRLVWNSFVSVTEQMIEYMGGEMMTFAEFCGLLSASCAELSVGIVPPTHDKVMVSEPDRFRSTGTKIVIVLGVCDRAFPREYGSEGIISDAERAELADAGLALAPDAYGKQVEEQFLIYSVLCAASESLYLMSPLSDRDGKSLGESEVIKRLREKLFPDIEIEDGKADNALPENREYIFRRLSSKLYSNDGAENLTPLWHTAFTEFEKHPAYSARAKRLSEMNARRGEPRKISGAVAEKLYGTPLVLSVSRLEKYNSCAFSFFMRYGLLARERMLGGFQASDMGTVLHSVLCEYFKDKSECGADYGDITREECRAEISALVDKTAYDGGEALIAQSFCSKYLALRMKSIAEATAWKLVKFYAQSKFRPCGFEISFGRRGTLPPYKLKNAECEAYLEGFIDRADKMYNGEHGYVFITDYKSSEKKLDPELAEAGISFQPLIYAKAICASDTDSEPAAMLYMQMNDPFIKSIDEPTDAELEKGLNDEIKTHGIFLDDPTVLNGIDASHNDKSAVHYIKCDTKSVLCREELTSRLDRAEQKAAETADNISKGTIGANPVRISGYNSCTYCPYSSVCGKE